MKRKIKLSEEPIQALERFDPGYRGRHIQVGADFEVGRPASPPDQTSFDVYVNVHCCVYYHVHVPELVALEKEDPG